MTTLFPIVNPSCHPVDTASVSLFWSVSHLPMDWVPTAAVPGNRRDLNWNRHGAGGELEEDQAILINQLYQARLLISKERFAVWNCTHQQIQLILLIQCLMIAMKELWDLAQENLVLTYKVAVVFWINMYGCQRHPRHVPLSVKQLKNDSYC